jgi:hypothetical protein
MKTYCGGGGYNSTHFEPRYKMEVSDQLHDPAALSPRGDPRYPLDTRLGESQILSGRGGGEKKIPSPPCRESNRRRPVCSLVTIPTELSQLPNRAVVRKVVVMFTQTI